MAISLESRQALALSGRFIAMRRSKKPPRDAAVGWDHPAEAYSGWLRERLVDLMPFAAVDELSIDAFSTQTVLRKVDHSRENTRVRAEAIAQVEATIRITVSDPRGVEAWLLRGVGPQKAFGYGAFVPAADPLGTG